MQNLYNTVYHKISYEYNRVPRTERPIDEDLIIAGGVDVNIALPVMRAQRLFR